MERYHHAHSTRLKNHNLAHYPHFAAHKEDFAAHKEDFAAHKEDFAAHKEDFAAHKEGYDILLAFNKDPGAALRVPLDQDCDAEAICLARAANIVRNDMPKWQASFSGYFDLDCQAKSVPHSLSALVAMILNDTIKSQGCDDVSQAALSIAQLLQYNISVHLKVSAHTSSARETPLPIYLGLMVQERET